VNRLPLAKSPFSDSTNDQEENKAQEDRVTRFWRFRPCSRVVCNLCSQKSREALEGRSVIAKMNAIENETKQILGKNSCRDASFGTEHYPGPSGYRT
jgi:hypothetical protein